MLSPSGVIRPLRFRHKQASGPGTFSASTRRLLRSRTGHRSGRPPGSRAARDPRRGGRAGGGGGGAGGGGRRGGGGGAGGGGRGGGGRGGSNLRSITGPVAVLVPLSFDWCDSPRRLGRHRARAPRRGSRRPVERTEAKRSFAYRSPAIATWKSQSRLANSSLDSHRANRPPSLAEWEATSGGEGGRGEGGGGAGGGGRGRERRGGGGGRSARSWKPDDVEQAHTDGVPPWRGGPYRPSRIGGACGPHACRPQRKRSL